MAPGQNCNNKEHIYTNHNHLTLFASYLAETSLIIVSSEFLADPLTWDGITHGLVDGFVRWMVRQGYSIGSVNVRLATMKVYTRLATRVGTIPATEYGLIKLVQGYRHKEGRNIDQGRDKTRVGVKKAIGLVGLSAHDCRHFWVMSAIKGGTDIKNLQDAGEWSSPAMPLRYAESSKIANRGVVLG